ncbi:MAG TPA: hypothetical protein VMB80_15095, partial [Candidatus Acidoferrum sp.]|nr:hypothetical protein [Candidatus Acidoferrum sp.]
MLYELKRRFRRGSVNQHYQRSATSAPALSFNQVNSSAKSSRKRGRFVAFTFCPSTPGHGWHPFP